MWISSSLESRQSHKNHGLLLVFMVTTFLDGILDGYLYDPWGVWGKETKWTPKKKKFPKTIPSGKVVMPNLVASGSCGCT